jgi:hypothetical protein
MDGFEFVSYILNFSNTFGLLPGWFAVAAKQWLAHYPWLVLQYHGGMLLW